MSASATKTEASDTLVSVVYQVNTTTLDKTEDSDTLVSTFYEVAPAEEVHLVVTEASDTVVSTAKSTSSNIFINRGRTYSVLGFPDERVSTGIGEPNNRVRSTVGNSRDRVGANPKPDSRKVKAII
jgi:hypothetical protein